MFAKYLVVFALSVVSVASSDVTIFVINDDVADTFKTIDGCSYQACDQLCRRLGFPGGACVGDRCKCDNFKQLKDDVMYTIEAVEGCSYQACDQLCRRLGFPGGACVGDRCKCDNFKQVKSIKEYIENTATQIRKQKQEVPHHEIILKGEPGATVPENCNAVQCDDMCHRLHYPGGMCIGGNCQCYQ